MYHTELMANAHQEVVLDEGTVAERRWRVAPADGCMACQLLIAAGAAGASRVVRSSVRQRVGDQNCSVWSARTLKICVRLLVDHTERRARSDVLLKAYGRRAVASNDDIECIDPTAEPRTQHR